MAEKSPALTKPSLLQSPRALLAITSTWPLSVLTGRAPLAPVRLAVVKVSGTLVPEGQARLAVKLSVTSVPLANGPVVLTETTPPVALPVPPVMPT